MVGCLSYTTSEGWTRRRFMAACGGATVALATGGLGGCQQRGHHAGRLVCYSAGPAWLAQAASAMYEEQTGQPVELFTATTGQVMAKLQAERYNRRADVVVLASRLAAEHLKQQSRLLAYRPSAVVFADDSSNDPDGTYHTSASAAVGLAFRDEHWDAQLTWDDVLSGRFVGRVVMPAPSRSGSAADFVIAFVQRHGESAWDLFQQAKHGGMEIGGANSQAIGGLLTGAYDAIFAAVDYLILRQVQQNAPVRLLLPRDGCPLVERPIMIQKGTHLAEQAQAFVDMYLSTALQAQVATGHLLPAVAKVAPSDLRQAAGLPKPWSMNISDAVRDQSRILRRFQYEIERAVI